MGQDDDFSVSLLYKYRMKFRGDIKHGKLASSAPSVKAVRRFRTKPYEAANLVKKQGEYLSELPHE